jgi:hypothetical protein
MPWRKATLAALCILIGLYMLEGIGSAVRPPAEAYSGQT